jgi:hypothetical protein
MLLRTDYASAAARSARWRSTATCPACPSGPLVASLGYPATATIYCAVGILFTPVIAVYWRRRAVVGGCADELEVKPRRWGAAMNSPLTCGIVTSG